jgi:hypothetical protein
MSPLPRYILPYYLSICGSENRQVLSSGACQIKAVFDGGTLLRRRRHGDHGSREHCGEPQSSLHETPPKVSAPKPTALIGTSGRAIQDAF